MTMKRTILALTLCLMPSLALATNPTSCAASQQQNIYHCTDGDGTNYTVENAASAEAAALAIAAQQQEQNQAQAQGQSSENTNTNQNVNGGNSVNIEGNPKHTTSLTAGIGVNLSVPVNQGFVGRQRMAEADWWMAHGQSCIAFDIMSKSRFLRGKAPKFICGDNG